MILFLHIHKAREAMAMYYMPTHVIDQFAYLVPLAEALTAYRDILGIRRPFHGGSHMNVWSHNAENGTRIDLLIPADVPSPPSSGYWFTYNGTPVHVR